MNPTTSILLFVLLLLGLLQVKHFLVDFVLQTDDQIATKGTYGSLVGISHSVWHMLGTSVVLLLAWLVVPEIGVALVIALSVLDGVAHYHIDWIKSNYGSWTPKDKAFWNALGLDQMAHQLTYLLLVGALLFA